MILYVDNADNKVIYILYRYIELCRYLLNF